MTTDGLASVSYDAATNRITNAGFEYDAAGNQMRKVRIDGSAQKFQYDAANRLVKVTDDYGYTLGIYTYGNSAERLIAEEGNVRTYYACGGNAEYVEMNGATTPVWSKSYVFLGSRLLATTTPNGSGGEFIQYHHPDRLGTRLVTNAQNTTFFEQQTLPFGTALNESAPAGGMTGGTNRRFTTYDRSVATGLDYALNRHYDSQQGRFTQVDPAGMGATTLSNPQTLNLYAYCANDPINHLDPSGLGFFSFLKKIFKRILHALIHAVIKAVFTFIQTLIMTGSLHAAVVAAIAAGVADFLKQIGWPTKGYWTIIPGGTPQWNPNVVPILATGASDLNRWIIWNFGARLTVRPGSFAACVGNLASTGLNKDAADLINQINAAEGTSKDLLAVTWMNENHFGMRPGPNTNKHNGDYKTGDYLKWDVGPFHINIGYTLGAVQDKSVNFGGLTVQGVFGYTFYDPSGTTPTNTFDGVPLENGRMAARRLNASGSTDRQRAVNYAGKKNGPARGRSYDAWHKAFETFFNCYKG
jgi:RHS repeat-associated protein